ncbi:60s ribosomal protein l36 [Neofusicoccum parvum]|nr:60s ribosomal protein l36 [Neofusicoccum parvum]
MAMTPEALEALLASPALEPPPGVTANFDNPPNENGLAWGVTTFCMVIATLCLFLRGYARMWLEKTVRVEEGKGAYWGTAYAAYALIFEPGYYVHTWNLTMGDLIHPLYLILIYGCCYSAVLPLIKTAILLDWCRIFVPSDRKKNFFWWGCMIVIAFQCIWGLLCIILLNMQCRPHEAIWKFYLPSKCYDLPKVMLTSASCQVITDIVMVFLPQKMIWGLHLNWQKKLGVSIIFGVGVVASVAACFRLAHTVTFSKTTDTMYYIGPLLFWACAEMTCGFFILSVPCLPKIVKESSLPRAIKRALGLSVKSTTGPSNGTPSGSGSHHLSRPSKSGIAAADSYYKIREDGVMLGDVERSESQEGLRGEYERGEAAKGGAVRVTRTTHISVTTDAQSVSDLEDNAAPWTRRVSHT